MKSSRVPAEWYGRFDSELFGSTNTLGWLAPLSTAGQPSSVNQNGLDCGTQAVGVADSMPPGRLKCWLVHQLRMSLKRNTQGLPALPSVMGLRTCASRSEELA